MHCGRILMTCFGTGCFVLLVKLLLVTSCAEIIPCSRGLNELDHDGRQINAKCVLLIDDLDRCNINHLSSMFRKEKNTP